MAGKGPLPKDPSRRARGRRGESTRLIVAAPTSQPKLPVRMPNGEPWPEITRAWWRQWGKDPLAAEFRATDWSELRDTAAIHGAYWSGDLKLAGELRLRTARHGATAEDRARLRIQYAQADEVEGRVKRRQEGEAQRRYSGLRAVDS